MFARSILALAATALGAYASTNLTVSTPASLIECQPVLLSWTGGTSPYYLSIIPGGESSSAALKDFGEQTGTSITWTVDIASGTSVSVKVTDSTGTINYDSAVTIQSGSDSSCLSSSTSASGSTGSASSTSSSSSTAAAADSSASTSDSSSSATSSAADSSSTSASGSSSSTASASSSSSTSGAPGFASVSMAGAALAAAAGAITYLL